MKRHLLMPLAMLGLSLLLGCTSLPGDAPRPLRVGISPNYPPVAFASGDQLLGLEVDFANMVARELDRPLELVPVPFAELFDKLQAGELDIVMSGVTRTEERSRRVLFSKPYITVALSAMVRPEDAAQYRKPLDVKKAPVTVAAEPATTGAEFVRVYCFGAKEKTTLSPMEAPQALQDGRIDLYIHDAPALKWVASASAKPPAVLDMVLEGQELAWALPKRDRAMQRRLNAMIDRWEASGALASTMQRWIPDSLGSEQDQAKVAELEDGVLFLNLSAASAPEGHTATVTIDDKPRGTWPLQNAAWMATYLPPGEHRIVIQAEGFKDLERKESIAAGRSVWRKLTLE